MFDFLKNLTKSEEEKQQELFSAYLDDTLSPDQRQAFESRLAEDADLRAEIELAQMIRQQMLEMPRRSVPRSFTLNASVYGTPQKEPLVQAYPLLRAATVMTAFFFVMALGLSVFTSQGSGGTASVAQTAMEPAPAALEAPMQESGIALDEAAEKSMPPETEAEEPIVVQEEVTEVVVEKVTAEEEVAEAEEMPAEMVPQATMTLELTESKEYIITEDTQLEAADSTGAEAAAGEAVAVGPTALATATVSSLPRPEALETAVPRAAEPVTQLPDESANAIEGETAVDDDALEMVQPRLSLTTWQWLILGLGLLLLFLIAVTLLARRRI